VRVGLGSDLLGPDQRGRGKELVYRARLESPVHALESAPRCPRGRKLADIMGLAGDPLSVPEHFAEPDRVALVRQEGKGSQGQHRPLTAS